MNTFDAEKYVSRFEAETTQPAETVAEVQNQEPVKQESNSVPQEKTPEVESKSETKVVEATETKTDTKEEREWWEKDEIAYETQEKREQDEAEILRKQLAEYETRLKQLQEVPEVLAILEAKKSGKEVTEVLKEFVGTDFDKLTPRELKELDLKSKGFNEEEVKELLEEFDEKSTAKQKLETLDIREKLKSEQKSKMEQLLKNVPQQQTTINPKEIKIQENYQKAESEVNNLDTLVGQEVYGVTLTKEIVDSVKNAIANEWVKGDAENGFDIPGSFDFHFKAKYTPLIVKANVQRATAKAKESVLNELTRPDKNITDRAGTEQLKDGYDETRGQIKSIWSR